MIAIVDYGMSNLRSVLRGLQAVGAAARVVSNPSDLVSAHAIVLPGDGAFGRAMENLKRDGWVKHLCRSIELGIPFLGICLGMQLLFETSEEMGEHVGLGIFAGRVKRFTSGKVPQIGWNQLLVRQGSGLLAGVDNASYAYFVHSYFCEPRDAAIITAMTDYGVEYAAVVERENIWGAQFHPEKSGQVGLKMLQNFAAKDDHISRD